MTAETEPAAKPELPGWAWDSDTGAQHPSGAEIRHDLGNSGWLWWRAPIIGSPSCHDPKLTAAEAAAAALGYEIIKFTSIGRPAFLARRAGWSGTSKPSAELAALAALDHAAREQPAERPGEAPKVRCLGKGQRSVETGDGFVSATPCPACGHTRCGPDCGCRGVVTCPHWEEEGDPDICDTCRYAAPEPAEREQGAGGPACAKCGAATNLCRVLRGPDSAATFECWDERACAKRAEQLAASRAESRAASEAESRPAAGEGAGGGSDRRANHVRFWDAVNAYAQACGGDTSSVTVGGARMDAVVAVDRMVDEIEQYGRRCERKRLEGRIAEIEERNTVIIHGLQDQLLAQDRVLEELRAERDAKVARLEAVEVSLLFAEGAAKAGHARIVELQSRPCPHCAATPDQDPAPNEGDVDWDERDRVQLWWDTYNAALPEMMRRCESHEGGDRLAHEGAAMYATQAHGPLAPQETKP